MAAPSGSKGGRLPSGQEYPGSGLPYSQGFGRHSSGSASSVFQAKPSAAGDAIGPFAKPLPRRSSRQRGLAELSTSSSSDEDGPQKKKERHSKAPLNTAEMQLEVLRQFVDGHEDLQGANEHGEETHGFPTSFVAPEEEKDRLLAIGGAEALLALPPPDIRANPISGKTGGARDFRKRTSAIKRRVDNLEQKGYYVRSQKPKSPPGSTVISPRTLFGRTDQGSNGAGNTELEDSTAIAQSASRFSTLSSIHAMKGTPPPPPRERRFVSAAATSAEQLVAFSSDKGLADGMDAAQPPSRSKSRYKEVIKTRRSRRPSGASRGPRSSMEYPRRSENQERETAEDEEATAMNVERALDKFDDLEISTRMDVSMDQGPKGSSFGQAIYPTNTGWKGSRAPPGLSHIGTTRINSSVVHAARDSQYKPQASRHLQPSDGPSTRSEARYESGLSRPGSAVIGTLDSNPQGKTIRYPKSVCPPLLNSQAAEALALDHYRKSEMLSRATLPSRTVGDRKGPTATLQNALKKMGNTISTTWQGLVQSHEARLPLTTMLSQRPTGSERIEGSRNVSRGDEIGRSFLEKNRDQIAEENTGELRRANAETSVSEFSALSTDEERRQVRIKLLRHLSEKWNSILNHAKNDDRIQNRAWISTTVVNSLGSSTLGSGIFNEQGYEGVMDEGEEGLLNMFKAKMFVTFDQLMAGCSSTWSDAPKAAMIEDILTRVKQAWRSTLLWFGRLGVIHPGSANRLQAEYEVATEWGSDGACAFVWDDIREFLGKRLVSADTAAQRMANTGTEKRSGDVRGDLTPTATIPDIEQPEDQLLQDEFMEARSQENTALRENLRENSVKFDRPIKNRTTKHLSRADELSRIAHTRETPPENRQRFEQTAKRPGGYMTRESEFLSFPALLPPEENWGSSTNESSDEDLRKAVKALEKGGKRRIRGKNGSGGTHDKRDTPSILPSDRMPTTTREVASKYKLYLLNPGEIPQDRDLVNLKYLVENKVMNDGHGIVATEFMEDDSGEQYLFFRYQDRDWQTLDDTTGETPEKTRKYRELRRRIAKHFDISVMSIRNHQFYSGSLFADYVVRILQAAKGVRGSEKYSPPTPKYDAGIESPALHNNTRFILFEGEQKIRLNFYTNPRLTGGWSEEDKAQDEYVHIVKSDNVSAMAAYNVAFSGDWKRNIQANVRGSFLEMHAEFERLYALDIGHNSESCRTAVSNAMQRAQYNHTGSVPTAILTYLQIAKSHLYRMQELQMPETVGGLHMIIVGSTIFDAEVKKVHEFARLMGQLSVDAIGRLKNIADLYDYLGNLAEARTTWEAKENLLGGPKGRQQLGALDQRIAATTEDTGRPRRLPKCNTCARLGHPDITHSWTTCPHALKAEKEDKNSRGKGKGKGKGGKGSKARGKTAAAKAVGTDNPQNQQQGAAGNDQRGKGKGKGKGQRVMVEPERQCGVVFPGQNHAPWHHNKEMEYRAAHYKATGKNPGYTQCSVKGCPMTHVKVDTALFPKISQDDLCCNKIARQMNFSADEQRAKNPNFTHCFKAAKPKNI